RFSRDWSSDVCSSDLTFSFGMHWVVLQSVAWLGMAVTYSHETCFTEALAKTFDGRHPCKLCKFVAENQKSEKKPDAKKVETKFEIGRASCRERKKITK